MLSFLILRLAVQQHQESIATDIIDDKLLDDVFFIVKQCVIRAAGCGNLDGLCAVSNNGWVHQIFSPICFTKFLHKPFSVWAIEDENKLLAVPKKPFFLSLPVEEAIIICILLPKLFWPTVRKNCSSDREKSFEIRDWRPRICKIFEITRIIY